MAYTNRGRVILVVCSLVCDQYRRIHHKWRCPERRVGPAMQALANQQSSPPARS